MLSKIITRTQWWCWNILRQEHNSSAIGFLFNGFWCQVWQDDNHHSYCKFQSCAWLLWFVITVYAFITKDINLNGLFSFESIFYILILREFKVNVLLYHFCIMPLHLFGRIFKWNFFLNQIYPESSIFRLTPNTMLIVFGFYKIMQLNLPHTMSNLLFVSYILFLGLF